jgi:hypothetical protein
LRGGIIPPLNRARSRSHPATRFSPLKSPPPKPQSDRLLGYVAGDDWRGPSSDLDWEIGAARKLFGEFAGMSEEELANV